MAEKFGFLTGNCYSSKPLSRNCFTTLNNRIGSGHGSNILTRSISEQRYLAHHLDLLILLINTCINWQWQPLKLAQPGINQGHWSIDWLPTYDFPLVVGSNNSGHKYIEPFQRYAYLKSWHKYMDYIQRRFKFHSRPSHFSTWHDAEYATLTKNNTAQSFRNDPNSLDTHWFSWFSAC